MNSNLTAHKKYSIEANHSPPLLKNSVIINFNFTNILNDKMDKIDKMDNNNTISKKILKNIIYSNRY